MVSLISLWLPILLSAIAVFVASSLIHMFTPWHKPDLRKFPDEDRLLEALRNMSPAPGDYAAPKPDNMAELSSDAYKAKLARGPQVVLTVFRPGASSMGKSLVAWFVYAIVVAVFAAYVASVTLGSGADYMLVFRVCSTVTFAAYAIGVWQGWIWYSRDTGAMVRTTVDALLYALLTGGLFGTFWP